MCNSQWLLGSQDHTDKKSQQTNTNCLNFLKNVNAIVFRDEGNILAHISLLGH